LRYAAGNGQLEVLKLLIEKGVDIHDENNEPTQLGKDDFSMRNNLFVDEEIGLDISNDDALRLATKNGELKVIKLLLERGEHTY
jgi:ankyrin repeat protein